MRLALAVTVMLGCGSVAPRTYLVRDRVRVGDVSGGIVVRGGPWQSCVANACAIYPDLVSGDRLLFKRDAGFTISFGNASYIVVREADVLGTITAGVPDKPPRTAAERAFWEKLISAREAWARRHVRP